MKNTDVELIQHTLAGDETAFAELVNRHQKPVHTLAWRKIGDFQTAEEITQDTFLKVYQRLHTLKDPNQFSGWLYVIATRRCYAWLRKKRIRTDPLEDVDTTMIHKDAYSHHVIEDRRNSAVEAHREAVKKLLAKLKESERTVMTLHYLGEMTVEEISRFIGVSAGTIKSRLQRARNRLQKEETMIREALDHFQISPNLTDNIMQEVMRLKPTPTGSKPLIPWAVAASTAVLIVLMLGIGNQHLARFQKPYSLEAQSELSVELVDAQIVQNLELESDVRRQFGNTPAVRINGNSKQIPNEVFLTDVQSEGENMSNQKQQWIHSKRVKGAPIMNLSTTPDGDLYAFANYLSVYRQSKDTWQHLTSINKLRTNWGGDPSIVKWNNTLYFSISNNFYSSTDNGETWDLLYSWKKGQYQFPINLILTEGTFYLAFRNGVFQSDDNGKTWKNISDGLKGRSVHFIESLINIQNTVFVGANDGCYRYNGNGWERLKFPSKIFSVVSTAADAGKLYVMAELSWKANQEFKRTWGIFRSTDLGDSWIDITPTHAWQLDGNRPNIVLIAVGETLLAMEHGMVRSLDSGDTWLNPQTQDTSPSMGNLSPVAVMNDQTIYVGSHNGLYSSTDLGVSWNKINIRENGGRIYNLIALKKTDKTQSPSLYAIVDGETLGTNEIQKTDDSGTSWKRVQIAIPMTDPIRRVNPDSTQIVKSDNVLYAKSKDAIGGVKKVYIHRVSNDGKTLERIQGMPAFSSEGLDEELSDDEVLGATQFFKQLAQPNFEKGGKPRKNLIDKGLRGAFAVDKDTFYIEFNYKLFRWKFGDTELYDTEQEETIELSEDIIKRDIKLAVSGNTVYVGKRDGHFLVSFDRATNWIDFTPALPFAVNDYKQILVAGTTVYVATDAGIIISDDGRNWNTITNAAGDNLIMEHLANDGNILYGVTEKSGIYRLENGSWNQIISEIPGDITSLAVDGNTLYVGTRNQGMLHYTFE